VAYTSRYRQKRRIRRAIRLAKRLFGVCIAAGLTWLLIIGIKYWVYNSDVFLVKNIEINGIHLLDGEKMQKIIAIPPDRKIFDVDLERIKSCIGINPYIASAALGKRYPSTIKIDITERVPVAYIALEKMYLVDAEGCLLPRIHSEAARADYPIITGITVHKAQPGNLLGNIRVTRSLNLLRLVKEILPEFRDTISEIHNGSDGALSMYLSDSGTRIDCGIDNIRHKLTKLQLFLVHQQMNEPEKKLIYINLNYKNQIVVKEHS